MKKNYERPILKIITISSNEAVTLSGVEKGVGGLITSKFGTGENAVFY
ncbi:MAG: hypothetical protein LUH47_04250 [Clostridiales bacterium]|nr:hypothetical protein [Clostridiales bacterium]